MKQIIGNKEIMTDIKLREAMEKNDNTQTHFQRVLSEEKRAVRTDFSDINFQKDFPELLDLIDKYCVIQDGKLMLKEPDKTDIYELYSEISNQSRGVLNLFEPVTKDGKEVGLDYSALPLQSAALKDISIALEAKHGKENKEKGDMKTNITTDIKLREAMEKNDNTQTHFQRVLSEEKGAVRTDFSDMNFQKDFPELLDLIDKYCVVQDSKLMLKEPDKTDIDKLYSEISNQSRGVLNLFEPVTKDGKEVGLDYSALPLQSAALKDISIALEAKHGKENKEKGDMKTNITTDIKKDIKTDDKEDSRFKEMYDELRRTEKRNAKKIEAFMTRVSDIGFRRAFHEYNINDLKKNPAWFVDTSKLDNITFPQKTNATSDLDRLVRDVAKGVAKFMNAVVEKGLIGAMKEVDQKIHESIMNYNPLNNEGFISRKQAEEFAKMSKNKKQEPTATDNITLASDNSSSLKETLTKLSEQPVPKTNIPSKKETYSFTDETVSNINLNKNNSR